MRLLVVLSLITYFGARSPQLHANSKLKWEGQIPSVGDTPEKWNKLLDYLEENKLHYGVLAASFRVILFFEDLNTKKRAFQNIVRLIDLGYPDSLFHLFVSGNLELDAQDHFAQSYNLYKAIINRIKKMKKWSDDFFLKIDQENFRKYLFYQAIDLYGQKKFEEALKILDDMLKRPSFDQDFAFIKKVVRTQARILFEQEKYDKSLAIYDEFLLRVNPIKPTDWLEKAWNLFYLKKYEHALGALYNLEAKSSQEYNNFEKYIIRASIYLNRCSIKNVEKLIEKFEEDYKSVLNGIINGKVLKKFKKLRILARFYEPRYKAVMSNLQHVRKERREIKNAPRSVRGIMNYLYRSEMALLKKYSRFFEEKAINKAAKDLTMLYESLKFLKFGTAREKYNPATVFRPKEEVEENLVYEIDLEKRGFIFRWRQLGQFWRDERSKYKVKIKDQCKIEL